jgi:uncharacterized protein
LTFFSTAAEQDPVVSCRPHCGACCIAPSISSPLPGMPDGKPAGMACLHLDQQMRCRIFADPARPAVCDSLQPRWSMCGDGPRAASMNLAELERLTMP